MLKRDYLLEGIEKGWYLDAYWVKSILSLFQTEAKEHYIARRDKDGYYYLDDAGNKIHLEDATDITKPLFRVGEMIDVPLESNVKAPGIKGGFRTSVGCLIMNWILVVSPFRGLVSYINKPFTPNHVAKQIIPRWSRSRSKVSDKHPERDGEIFTEDYIKFKNHVLFLTNFTQTVIPSVSEKALRTNPVLEKRKQELYNEYKDQIQDPVIAAKIDKELAKIDEEWLKDDESSGFIYGGNMYGNIRKKLNTHFGITTGLDDKPVFVPGSLKEGIKLDNLSVYVNDSYSGSIGRGLETQEGGVMVKDALRSAANLKVGKDECGTRHGFYMRMADNVDDNHKYMNYWYLDESGKSIQITQENIASLSGKVIKLRLPSYCVAGNSSYCAKCSGPNITAFENGIASINAQPGSIIMLLKMKKMHNTAKEITTWTDDYIT